MARRSHASFPNGKSGMFGEEQGSNTRDPMVIKIGSIYYCYYTGVSR